MNSETNVQNGKMKCSYCDKRFNHHVDLVYHECLHQGEPNYHD